MRTYHCDRENETDLRNLFENILHSVCWDVLIDFSGFEEVDISRTVELLRGRVGHYIFISTDSIYMVCKSYGTEKREEWQDERPIDPELRQKLSQEDEYVVGICLRR